MKRNTTFNETVTELKMDSQIKVRMTNIYFARPIDNFKRKDYDYKHEQGND